MGQEFIEYDGGNDDFFNLVFDDVQNKIPGYDDDDNFIFENLHKDEYEFFPPKKITLDEFVKELYELIDPHHAIIVTTKMLLMVEKAFTEEYGKNWNKLRRDDKRKKERILQKFHENAEIILENIQNEPDKYLRYVRQYILKKYTH